MRAIVLLPAVIHITNGVFTASDRPRDTDITVFYILLCSENTLLDEEITRGPLPQLRLGMSIISSNDARTKYEVDENS